MLKLRSSRPYVYVCAVEDLVRAQIEASDKKLTLLNEPEMYIALEVRPRPWVLDSVSYEFTYLGIS